MIMNARRLRWLIMWAGVLVPMLCLPFLKGEPFVGVGVVLFGLLLVVTGAGIVPNSTKPHIDKSAPSDAFYQRRKRKIIAITVAIFLLAGLCPPWMLTFDMGAHIQGAIGVITLSSTRRG